MNCFRDDVDASCKAEAATWHKIKAFALLLPRLLAGLVLLIHLPALFLVALLVWLSSPGPILVKKAYLRSQGEDLVYLYEFRTECWRTWQPTQLGTLLHLSNMHRLPRLLNVLQGEVNAGERVTSV